MLNRITNTTTILVRKGTPPPRATRVMMTGLNRYIGSSRTRSNTTALSSEISSDSTTSASATTTTTTTDNSSPSQHVLKLLPNDHQPQFINSLSGKELSSFILLSMMTSSQPLINLSTKLLPYTPNLLVKTFVYPIYCGGETFKEVRETGRKLRNRGIGNMMLSYSVEDAEGTGVSSSSSSLVDNAVAEICKSVDEVLVPHYDETAQSFIDKTSSTAAGQGFIALKPTGLMSGASEILKNFENPSYADKWKQYLSVCRTICQHVADKGQGKVAVVFDAEKKILQNGVYAAQRAMMEEFNKDNSQVIVIGTIQMYLLDSIDQVKLELELAKRNNYKLGLKLVRGAYIHSEPDRINTIHRTKEETDLSYDHGVSLILDDISEAIKYKTPGSTTSAVGKLIVATHNENSCALVDQRLKHEAPLGDIQSSALSDFVVFGQLMGMADDQSYELAKRGHSVIKYVPWGPAQETKEYLVRRLEENGDAAREGGWKYVRYGLKELFGRVSRSKTSQPIR